MIVHSLNGRDTLAPIIGDPARLRVVPHPVFPSDPERHDDGRTVLCFGVIRPYKGLGDAIEAVRRVGDARLLVAGDPLEPIESLPHRRARGSTSSGGSAICRRPRSTARSARRRVALFPYRPELDQSGALLRALGAGVPAVAYDVGGIAEPVRALRRRTRRSRRRRRGARRLRCDELLADPRRARSGARGRATRTRRARPGMLPPARISASTRRSS